MIGKLQVNKKETVTICVPTCMRPQMLGECLRSIANSRMPPDLETRLTVIDNDAKESAREMFSSLRFPFAARYIVEPRRGLCAVRNRALDETQKENADYLAFCDDDQIVDDNWLCALVDGMNETGADAISGYVEQGYPNGKVPWWIRPSKTKPDENAKIKPGFGPGLLLMKARVFVELRFDDDFNLTGAEDYDFSRRAMLRGFVSAYTGKAKAYEEAHPSRLTFVNYFMTQWQRQTAYVLSHRKTDGALKAALRFLPKGIIKFVKGVLYGVIGVFFGKKMLRRANQNIIAGLGMCYGVFKFGKFQKYANIDGQ